MCANQIRIWLNTNTIKISKENMMFLFSIRDLIAEKKKRRDDKKRQDLWFQLQINIIANNREGERERERKKSKRHCLA